MVGNFVTIDSIYGTFVVNRHCQFQAEALIKTGRTHIEDELAKIFVIVEKLSNGSIIIDGGANTGFFSVPVAQLTKNRDIKILSFEPQRQIFQGLSGTLVLNDLSHVMVYNMALGDKPGWTEIPHIDYSQPQDFGMVQIKDTLSDSRELLNANQCEIICIDHLNLPRLDFLKLDVEGREISALQGAHQTISQYRPWIWIEYFIIGKDTILNELSYLDNYQFHIMNYQNLLCAPAERLTDSGIKIIP